MRALFFTWTEQHTAHTLAPFVGLVLLQQLPPPASPSVNREQSVGVISFAESGLTGYALRIMGTRD